jgi:enoyl-CoA hydratase/carnithine racemase
MALGFATRKVPPSELLDTAFAFARKMTAKNPFGLRLTKEALNANLGAASLEQALHVENRNQSFLIAALKAKQGI